MARLRMSSFFLVSVAILALAFLENATCSRININPSNPTETEDLNVVFTCHLDSDVRKYSEVLLVDIVKGGKTNIAMLRKGNSIKYYHNNIEQRYEAEGVLNNVNKALTYLKLTLLLPRVEDSGRYECVISYLDAEGLIQNDRVTSTLTVNSHGNKATKFLETIVNGLVRRVEKLEKDAETHKKEYEALKKKVPEVLVTFCKKMEF